MSHLCLHPLVLRMWSCAFRLRRAVRRRSHATRHIAAQRSAFYEEVWRDAAEHCGASIVSRGDHAFEIHRGERMLNVCCNTTDLDSAETLELAGNKPAVHRLLSSRGLPTPRFLEFGLPTLSRALEFLATAREETDAACVVKPARDTGGGHGVTTGVTTPLELAWAIAAALPLGDQFLVEQQVAGENYRLLFLDGKCVDAVRRDPPQLVADGRSTVADLLNRLNADRVSRGLTGAQVLVTRDLDLRRTLARQGLHLGSVPAAGHRVILKTVINENSADDNESVRDQVCPAIIEDGLQAVSIVGARLAGVDVVTTDISRPLSETGGVILEVNTTPGFHYHYHNRSGRFAVARHVLDAILNAPSAIRELDHAI
jgi:cyanophycin synthetase